METLACLESHEEEHHVSSLFFVYKEGESGFRGREPEPPLASVIGSV